MQQILIAVRKGLEQQNWYCSLSEALAIPDICGWLETRNPKSQERYVRWFDHYVGGKYIAEVGPEHVRTVFLSGRDCYALRCAFLHQGSEDITAQRGKETVERFQFVVPPKGWMVHNNRLNNKLQLQVDRFCEDIVEGAERWLAEVGPRPDVQTEMGFQLRIYDVNGNVIE
jgi:hypothetical protein